MMSFLGALACQVKDGFFEMWGPVALILIVITTGWAIYEHRNSAENLRRIAKGIGWGLFFAVISLVGYALLFAPSIVHKKFQDAYGKLGTKNEELSKALNDSLPKFEAIIEQSVAGFSPDLNTYQVYLQVSITNYGAPSVAENFGLAIKSKFGNFNFTSAFMPPTNKLWDSHKKNKLLYEFSGSEALYEKTAKRIEKNDVVRGWLRFIMPGVDIEKLREDTAAVWILSCTDALGRPFLTVQQMGRVEHLRYYPGTESPSR